MIEAYLRRLDDLLSTSALVRDVEVVRRSIRDTEFEHGHDFLAARGQGAPGTDGGLKDGL